MTFPSINSLVQKFGSNCGRGLRGTMPVLLVVAGAMALLAGCESTAATTNATKPSSVTAPVASPLPKPVAATPAGETPPAGAPEASTEIVTIREGDLLKIAFPGAPKLDTTQQVRADGIVTLDILGEIKVVGQTPKELEKTLAKMFASELVSNEVTVAILSSSFDVYVTGAVLRPGKIVTTKPITAFQAIMEAGYDPINSNLEKVTLIRQDGRSKYTYLPLNLQLVLEGKETEPFYLKPSDTLQVPKKISIF